MFNFFKRSKKEISQPRQHTHARMHYDSASSSLIDRLSISSGNIDETIASQYNALISRARHAFTNNDYVKGFVSQACINIIGSNGIKVQSKCKDESLNKKLELHFRRWSKRRNCEVTGNMSLVDVQLMAVKSLMRDGEFFIIKNIIDGKLQLQVLEPTMIDASHQEHLSNDKIIINGVEINSYGKATAYYIKDTFNNRTRIPAEKVIHGFIQEYVGQKRGMSAIGTALIRLGLLSQFETAAIDNARQSAKVMGFASETLEESGFTTSYTDIEDNAPTEVDFGDGASIPVMSKGMRIHTIDSQFPSAEYGNFKDAILRAISLSLGYGVNFINLGNNLEKVNYSSARQGLLAERDAWKLLQRLIIDTLIEPIFESWLEIEYLSGRLGIISENRYQQILDKVRYQPRSWSWIDPVKDAKGITENLANNTMSLSEAILENGRDPDDVFEQIARDNEKLEQLGIKVSYTVTDYNEIDEDNEEDDAKEESTTNQQ